MDIHGQWPSVPHAPWWDGRNRFSSHPDSHWFNERKVFAQPDVRVGFAHSIFETDITDDFIVYVSREKMIRVARHHLRERFFDWCVIITCKKAGTNWVWCSWIERFSVAIKDASVVGCKRITSRLLCSNRFDFPWSRVAFHCHATRDSNWTSVFRSNGAESVGPGNNRRTVMLETR